jgi:hypothetical protein
MNNTPDLEEILDDFYWGTVNRPVKGIDEGNTDELDVIMTHKRNLEAEAKAAILAKHQAAVATAVREARIDPFDFVIPCEPECTPERHAYHQGQWDMAERITKHLEDKGNA